MSEEVEKILDHIKQEIKEADRKAEEACKKSKYSIQDYWMCVEFKFQGLHDLVAKEFGYPKAEIMPYRKKLNDFRKTLWD